MPDAALQLLRRTYVSHPAVIINKNKNRPKGRLYFWLGWQDSNLRMQQSKCCVLPLDDTPIFSCIKNPARWQGTLRYDFFRTLRVLPKKIHYSRLHSL